jgi:1,5-anhydro-D-fructose reductase (1,5-anhydro-D-mannitol-forming)
VNRSVAAGSPTLGAARPNRRCIVDGLRWGLVGASDIAATSIIPAIRAQPGSRVVAVHSRSQERGAAYARRHGIERNHVTLDALLGDDEVDAVYVSTTNDRHRAETIAAVGAGRHVLCEKPLALTVRDARAMVDAASAAGVVLATNHGRRNDPAVRAARDLLRAGALGAPLGARTVTAVLLAEHLRSWRLRGGSGGGVALDLLVHDADTLRFVLDDDVVSVQASATSQGLEAGAGEAGDRAEDVIAGVLSMAGGPVASFLCSYSTPHGAGALEVFGDQASLRAWREPGRPSGLLLRTAAGEQPVPLADSPPIGVTTITAFEAAVRGEGRLTATGEDGVASLGVALAARESARMGMRRPVETR